MNNTKCALLSLLMGLAIMLCIAGACRPTLSTMGEHNMESASEKENAPPFPKGVAVMKHRSLPEQLQLFWKFFFDKGERVPTETLPFLALNPPELLAATGKGLQGSWLGHSSLLINIDGHTILTDPVFERKVSWVGPTRFGNELPMPVSRLAAVDVVVISHDHYDHLNAFSIKQLINKTSSFVVPLGVGRRLQQWGVPAEKITELAWGENTVPQKGLTITATPAQHFSGRGLFDRNETLWASWVIQTDHHSIFFSGDSGYFPGFKEIGAAFGPFDVTFLECGAYNEDWANVHMFPEETLQAFFDLGGKVLQPVHWATFNLSFHAWYEPIERLVYAAGNQGAAVSTPVMGQIVNYDQPIHTQPWWLMAMAKSKTDPMQMRTEQWKDLQSDSLARQD